MPYNPDVRKEGSEDSYEKAKAQIQQAVTQEDWGKVKILAGELEKLQSQKSEKDAEEKIDKGAEPKQEKSETFYDISHFLEQLKNSLLTKIPDEFKNLVTEKIDTMRKKLEDDKTYGLGEFKTQDFPKFLRMLSCIGNINSLMESLNDQEVQQKVGLSVKGDEVGGIIGSTSMVLTLDKALTKIDALTDVSLEDREKLKNNLRDYVKWRYNSYGGERCQDYTVLKNVLPLLFDIKENFRLTEVESITAKSYRNK